MASNNSVPSASGRPNQMPNEKDEFGNPVKHHDSILMYCSYFTYDNKRKQFCHDIKVQEIANTLSQLEST